MSNRVINWGIVGTGYISNRFAQGMLEAKNTKLHAVFSRQRAKAEEFCKRYQAVNTYDDYDALLKDKNLDIIYLGIPNKQHFDLICKTLEAGIAVLSEKPMVDNQAQLDKVLELSAKNKLFLMEGMWTRFFPAMRQAKKWLNERAIGEPIAAIADFSYDLDPQKDQPWKAGILNHAGSLRDVGIYSIAFADMVFPFYPTNISTSVNMNSEVDDRMQLFFDYGNGKSAYLSAGFTHFGHPEAVIIGTHGRILIGPEFWHPTTAKLYKENELLEEFVEQYPATGFQYEIEAVRECLINNLNEPAEYTLASTTRISHLIEDLRKDWGIFYPSDFQ